MTIKPMLAVKADITDVQPGDLISAKLDGIRGINVDGQILSRTLKPIPNKHIQKEWNHKDLAGLDGEFILGDPTAPDAYRATNSALMRHEGQPEATLYVFDDFTVPRLSYKNRYEVLQGRVEYLQSKGFNILLLDQRPAGGNAEQIEEDVLAQGYEGIIARDPNQEYKFGRSTLKERKLLKIKRFSDSEAVVVGAVELMINENDPMINELGYQARSTAKDGLVPAGMLGALEVIDKATGVRFNIGTGFTRDQRERFWKQREHLKGMVLTYTHFTVGVKDKPRFPSFKGFRGDV
jgi:DNA ligase-1